VLLGPGQALDLVTRMPVGGPPGSVAPAVLAAVLSDPQLLAAMREPVAMRLLRVPRLIQLALCFAMVGEGYKTDANATRLLQALQQAPQQAAAAYAGDASRGRICH
jgi:hypothetical protein